MSDEKIKSHKIISKENLNVKQSARKNKRDNLLQKANTLPSNSGCYLMKNSAGSILYVGKAKDLKKRVVSYFNKSEKSPKTLMLISHIRSFEFIITNSDAESYVLENNLIKEHRPKYNIRLKDDKSYPYLSIDYKNEYPKIDYIRRPKRSKLVELFGPYPVGSNISEIMKIINKAFTLRDCSDYDFRTRKTPCLLYQMKQCSAPCVGYISKENYAKDLKNGLKILGSNKQFQASINLIKEKMLVAAEDELFEQAAILRDHIKQLEDFNKKSFDQNVENLGDKNTDIISFYMGDTEVDISIYLIRSGNLLGQKNFHFLKDDLLGDVEEDILTAIIQYYSDSNDVIPEKLVTNFSKSINQEFEMALTKLFKGLKFKVQGETQKYSNLLKITVAHAKECGRVRAANEDSVYIGLNRLKDLLKLKERPKTLECYDIAIWQGKSPTAAKIHFYEGKADKKFYRYYHLNERPEGNNDFAMMQEVFSRRLERDDLPDVFIVDGGIGQVSSVKKILDEFQVSIPVIGIAKARDISQGGFQKSEFLNSDERLIIPGRVNPYILNKCPSLMKIVVQMRDEAHRFSRKLHHKKEKSRIINSWVDSIKGMNDSVRKQILQATTNSVDELRKFDVLKLEKTLGISSKHARLVFEFLHAEEKN